MHHSTDNIRSALFYQKHAARAAQKAHYLTQLNMKALATNRQDLAGLTYWSARAAQTDARRMTDLASHFLTLALA